MARKSGPTISQEELYPLADEPGREEAHDARLLDLDVEQEAPFLRVQKRVSVRRGSLPEKNRYSPDLGRRRPRHCVRLRD